MCNLQPRAVWSLAALILLPPSLQAGGIPAKTLKELKAASVFIKVQSVPLGGLGKPVPLTGSGFLVHIEAGAGYIATNHHVVSPLAGEVLQGKPSVVFHSGTPNEKTVSAEIVASDPIRDLAVLKIAAFEGLPRAIEMAADVEANETMPIYAVGFPFGEQLASGGKSHPAITITKGSVSALRYDAQGQVNLVQIDAEINPGNSGGPIVDEKGKLLGVAVSKIMKARTIGFAIPVKALAEMMHGKLSAIAFDTLKVEDGTAQVSVEAALIDPRNKVKELVLHYRLAGDLKKLPQPDKDGKPAPLDGASTVRLTLDKGRGQGKLTLKSAVADKTLIAYQGVYKNALDKTIVLPITMATVDLTQVLYSDKLAGSLFGLVKTKPQKVFTHRMQAGKHYVIDMRSEPAHLDPRLIVRDADGKALAEDDGAGGIFNALIVFAPPKNADYQVVATVNKGSGPFVLRIREDSGREVGPTGWTKSGTLMADDPLDPVMRAPAQSFNLLLKKGKHYAVDMKSDAFDPYLRVENVAYANLKTEDVGGNGHSTLFFSPFQDSIYRVIATSYDYKAGRFDLKVRLTPGPKQFDIDAKGLKLSDTLTATDPIDIVNGRQAQFRCKVVEVKLKGGQKYQFDMTSKQMDPFLRIEDLRGRQLAADDDSGGNLDARLVFSPSADGVYRLVATQFDARLGAFELIGQLVGDRLRRDEDRPRRESAAPPE